MLDLIKKIEKKTNNLIFVLIGNGFILLVLGVLIIWTDFVLRLTIGIFVLVIAYLFLYMAYKLWAIKADIKKHLEF